MAVEVDIGTLCVEVQESTPLCINFPGGVQLCAQLGIDTGDPSAKTKALFAQVNAVLAPLAPLLNTIDLALAVTDAIKGVQDALSVPPDPTTLFQAIPKVIEKAAVLTGIPLALPSMIKGILLALVEAVLAMLGEIEAIGRAQTEIAEAATAAAEPGNEVLAAIVECETANLEKDIANQNESMQPINRIIGLVNAILEPLTGQTVPSFATISDTSAETLDAIRQTLEIVQQVASFLPG